MTTQNIYKPQLSHILDLGESCTRLRKSEHAPYMSLVDKIILFFKDIFCGGCRETDNLEFSYFSPLLEKKITYLKHLGEKPSDKFFVGVKQLLHIKSKFDFTGWSRSLGENQKYQAFTTALEQLKKTALENVDKWEKDPNTRKSTISKHAIRRWIEADEVQLKFAGYADEIVYKAEEIPVGAVLLNNHAAYVVFNDLRGFKQTFMQRVTVIRTTICKLFTGLPLFHSVAALGGGRFLHVAKDNEATGEQIGISSGKPLIEDFSDAKRAEQKKPPKYMFGYDIVAPNYNQMAKALKKTPDEVRELIRTKWCETLEISLNHPLSTFWNIIGTLCDSSRPEDYDITQVFQDNPEVGYSCSGLISAAFAKHGIDIVEKSKKRVEKAAPADFVKTNLFDIAFSSNRKSLLPHRPT